MELAELQAAVLRHLEASDALDLGSEVDRLALAETLAACLLAQVPGLAIARFDGSAALRECLACGFDARQPGRRRSRRSPVIAADSSTGAPTAADQRSAPPVLRVEVRGKR